MRNNKAFTLIETIIYVAITSIILTSCITISYSYSDFFSKNISSIYTEQDGLTTLELMLFGISLEKGNVSEKCNISMCQKSFTYISDGTSFNIHKNYEKK